MFPILNVGPLAIQAAGLILLLSFFIGTYLTSMLAHGLKTNADVIENSLLVGLIVGLVGARIGFMLIYPAVLIDNPLNLVSLTPSMLDTSFGVLVGTITAIILAQKKQLPLWPSLDTLTPFILFIFSGIHLANYASGSAFGSPTQLPWGIELWNEVRHPVQLYTLLLAALLLVWLINQTRFFKRTGFMRSGVLFNITLAGLSAITLFTQAFRADRVLLGPIDFYQVVALLVLIGSLALIHSRAFPARKKIGVIISLGSNTDAEANLSKAAQILGSDFRIRRQSTIYQTEDIHKEQKRKAFLNQAIEIETELPYPDLVLRLKAIEQEMGREPGNKQRVPLDLDILTYGSEVFTFRGKQIPAPDLKKYRYIALPLAEISPGFRHPADGLSIQKILDKISDDTQIKELSEEKNGITR